MRFPAPAVSPEEEPLDDLAKLLLGFLGREEGSAGGGWRCVQGGPER